MFVFTIRLRRQGLIATVEKYPRLFKILSCGRIDADHFKFVNMIGDKQYEEAEEAEKPNDDKRLSFQ